MSVWRVKSLRISSGLAIGSFKNLTGKDLTGLRRDCGSGASALVINTVELCIDAS